MEQAQSKEFYQSAMQCGTFLGIFWAIMYILLFKFPTDPILSTLSMAMMVSSPFVACSFAINYRKKECDNQIKYPQAWTFLFCMYICATLFSTLTNYIFLNIIDQGDFLINYNHILTETINTPGIDEITKLQFEKMQDMLLKLTASDIVWQILNSNIFCSLILPPIIALFVRKTS